MNATYMDIIVTDNYFELSVKAVRHDTAVTAENDAENPSPASSCCGKGPLVFSLWRPGRSSHFFQRQARKWPGKNEGYPRVRRGGCSSKDADPCKFTLLVTQLYLTRGSNSS